MNLFEPRQWSITNIICFKLYVFSLGLVIGGYFPETMMSLRWPLTIVILLTGVKVTHFYYFTKTN